MSRELDEAYRLPNRAEMPYRYSKIDAVFLWTNGGYQIARSKRNYPLFVDVLEEQLDDWQQFFENADVEYSVENRTDVDGTYFVLLPRTGFDSERVEGVPVTPLNETVEWMEQYEVNFQPALVIHVNISFSSLRRQWPVSDRMATRTKTGMGVRFGCCSGQRGRETDQPC